MRNRFISGLIAGGVLGATTGMYAYKRMSPRERRRMMKRGKKMMEGAAGFVDMVQSINMLR